MGFGGRYLYKAPETEIHRNDILSRVHIDQSLLVTANSVTESF